MIRIAIVEDEAEERSRLHDYAETYFSTKGEDAEYFFFEDGLFLLEKYPEQLDLIFLDIEMKHVDGIRTARQVRAFDAQVQILFVTHMIQYALEGYSVDASDFLVKPIRYPVFCSCMNRVMLKINTNSPRFLRTKQGREDFCCSIAQITYFESQNKKTILHRKGQEIVAVSETLSSLEEKLSEEPFFRCHKAVLVNLGYVQSIDATDVTVDGMRLPVSRHRRKEFLEKLTNYRGRML